MNLVKDGSDAFFYDTYALFGLARGSPNYRPYAESSRIATSSMNLYELYYMLSRDGQQVLADGLFNALIPAALQPSPETIKTAAKFRLKHVKLKLSYIDCLGYALAQEIKLPFLTGDEGFKGLPGVKFVKE
jgi:predicted nucleic acid-binding protein